MSPVSTDEIFERYLQKAITEINELGDEIAHAAGESRFPVVGSGHPMADILLLKYGPQASEAQEGVSFYGRAGQAIIKSLQRLNVDPLAVYGTNCLKFAGQKPEQARSMLTRELHIVQPKLIVAMGDDTLRFLNELDFPLADPVEPRLGELQRFTPTIDALVVPDIDASLDEQETEDGVLERLQGARPVVGGATSVLTRRRLAALGVARCGARRVLRGAREPAELLVVVGRRVHRVARHPRVLRAGLDPAAAAHLALALARDRRVRRPRRRLLARRLGRRRRRLRSSAPRRSPAGSSSTSSRRRRGSSSSR